MRAGDPLKRRVGGNGWSKVSLDLPGTGRMIREAGFDKTEGDPIEARGERDPHGTLRRIHARWADGWRVTIVVKKDGTGTLSYVRKLLVAKFIVGGAPA